MAGAIFPVKKDFPAFVMYGFEESAVKNFLKRTGAKRAAIQLPAGLGRHLPEIEAVFNRVGVETVFLADSCYGACDLADRAAKSLGCDVLVHYGHADMGLPSCLPTLYVEARASKDPLDSVNRAISKLKFKRVGLVTTVQHVGYLEKISELLLSRGIEPLIGKPGFRAKYPGQILGCDMGCAKSIAPKVDGFIYIGTGEFHPLGVTLATGKEVATINPISGDFRILDPEYKKFLGKRKAVIARAALADKFGVLMSTKIGQRRLNLAKKLVNLLRKKGREAHLLAVDDVAPEKIGNFGLEAYVCVACPRIPISDAERFEKPILTPFELKVMLGEAELEPYQIDEFSQEDSC